MMYSSHRSGRTLELGGGKAREAAERVVLSLKDEVENITHLDLRGNRLNAAFGWKLIKATLLF